MDEDREIKKIEIKIFKDQEENLNNYFLEVLIASRNNEKIPNESVLKILEIISEVWECEDAYAFELINQVYNKFKDRYDFKSTRKIVHEAYIENELGKKEIVVKMNLRLYIEEIIILTKEKKYKNDKECVSDIYKVAKNIAISRLSINAQKKISHYIKCVLAGYLARKYGFFLFSGVNRDKKITNSDLHDKVRHLVEKQPKKRGNNKS